ncbi:MAG: hypothetical protein ACRDRR_11535 [Pseudonocardiaceae bacterium]
MANYEVLVSECGGGVDCAKVARRRPDMIAIVGQAITDPVELATLGVGPGECAVQITEKLYCDGHEALEGRTT